jgi:hypothetical protein
MRMRTRIFQAVRPSVSERSEEIYRGMAAFQRENESESATRSETSFSALFLILISGRFVLRNAAWIAVWFCAKVGF